MAKPPDPAAGVDRALGLQAAGDLAGAEAVLRRVLAATPGDHEALHLLGVVLHQAGQGAAAIDALRGAVARQGDSPLYHNNLAAALRAAGDARGAEEHYRRAVALRPAYAQAHNNLGAVLQGRGRLEEALACYERALSIEPGFAAAAANRDALLLARVRDEDLRDLLIAGNTPRGMTGDFRGLCRRLAAQRGERALVVVAAAPKSASTFLANLLAAATGFPYVNLCYALLHNEHDLYPPALLAYNATGAVSQLHMKGTLPNARLMRCFGIRPLLLVRDLFDTAVSLYDQLQDEGYLRGPDRFSFAHTDVRYLALPPERRMDFIIDLMLPWYIDFYVSWTALVEAGECTARWVEFDRLTGDTAGVLGEILAFLGLAPDPAHLARVLEQGLARRERIPKFNRGVAGRGRERLTAAQRGRIEALAGYYPGVDFAPLGLGGGCN